MRTGLRKLQQVAEFAGSRANAASLVTGLAWGVPITLTVEAREGRPCRSTTFVVPTGPLQKCDVDACLALARRQLAGFGILRPAPEQLRAALVGGAVTDTDGNESRTLTLTGVLTLRSQGLGWAAVASSQGVAPGPW